MIKQGSRVKVHFYGAVNIKIWWVSNLIPKKTKKFEFGKNFMAILFEIKNNPYTPIFSLVGVGVGGISD